MAYLLALLTATALREEPNQVLCYYINDTENIQRIRVTSNTHDHFERIVFPMERILFTALPDSYLEVCLAQSSQMLLKTVQCKFLNVTEV